VEVIVLVQRCCWRKGENKKGSEGTVIGKIKMKGRRSKAMQQKWGF